MAYVVWDDTRNGDTVTSTTNLHASSAQYKPLAATGIPKTLGTSWPSSSASAWWAWSC